MNAAQIRALDAESLMNNPVFKGAVKAMEVYLESQALGTNPSDKDQCMKIIISKQLLRGIVREVSKFIEEGKIETMKELKKKNVAQRVFTR